jgi:ribosomal protein L11 methyltransferase
MNQEKLWLTEIEIPMDNVDFFMDGLEVLADSLTCFESDEDEKIWKLQIYNQSKPDLEVISDTLRELAKEINISKPTYLVSEIEETDWVSESQKNFEAVDAGKFFIYPSWRKDEIPDEKIAIEIDPKQAFGTGGHETTKGCLIALQELKGKFINVLDMGCGSGILAIAAAKLWTDSSVIAVDNDPICVETTIENAQINNVSNIEIAYSDGYDSNLVHENGSYEIIISNILATPLIEFAPKAKKYIASGGYIILAGLNSDQSDSVIEAHEKAGFLFVSKKEYGNWTILVMKAQ